VNGTYDNTACLQSALNALGVNFQSLEIQPPILPLSGTATVGNTPYSTGILVTSMSGSSFAGLSPGDAIQLWQGAAGSGPYYTINLININTTTFPPTQLFIPASGAPATGTYNWSFQGTSTQTNYYCVPTNTVQPALTWNPTALGRVHIWKGANVSCALPPPDATHAIVDDNVQPIDPFAITALPSGTAPLNFASYTSPNGPIAFDASGFSVSMAPPTGAGAMCSTIGGSLSAATYFFMISAADGEGGVTTPTAEASCTVASGSSGSATLTWTAQGGATSFHVFFGTASGAENHYVTVTNAAASPYTFKSTTTGALAGSPAAYPTAATLRAAIASGLTYALGAGIDVQANPVISEFPNSSSGTTAYYLAALTNAGQVQVASVSSPTGIAGICVGSCGTSAAAPSARIAVNGTAYCFFDNSPNPGDYLQPSTSTAGQCHGAGASYPANGVQIIGQVLQAPTSGTAP